MSLVVRDSFAAENESDFPNVKMSNSHPYVPSTLPYSTLF